MLRVAPRRLALRCALAAFAAGVLGSSGLSGVTAGRAAGAFPVEGHPEVPDSPWRQGAAARHSFPADASGATRVTAPGGVSLGFRLDGARPAPAFRAGEGARYEGVLGEGTTLTLRPVAAGVEDVVHFERRPGAEAVDYLVDVRQVAGVRRVGRVVEFLDEGGAPRLRMEAPSIRGADGAVAQAEVEVGCAHDASPAAPWGRAVVRPGVDECRVTVRWEGQGVRYPAALDPVWALTQNMAVSRGNTAGGLLPSGKFLVVGGRLCESAICTPLDSAELFDPATDSWALTGSQSKARDRYQGVYLPGKGFAVFGGDEGDISSTLSEYYDEATGSWVPLAPLAHPRADHVVVLLSDKKTVLVIGGINVEQSKALPVPVEHYDIATNTWSDGGLMVVSKFWTTGTELPDGKIFIPGGTTCNNCGILKDAELYDPVSRVSQALPQMINGRLGHGAMLTALQGKPSMLVIGGGTEKVEAFDLGTQAWSEVGNIGGKRAFFLTVPREDGSVIIAGGAAVPFFLAVKDAERFDPQTLLWGKAASMNVSRAIVSGGQLQDGRILILGGISGSILANGNTTNSAELFQASDIAEPCQSPGDCKSGFCADGVCCNEACTGTCQACTAAKKGGGLDGNCGPLPLGADPDDECPADEVSTCGRSGACDGNNACAFYATNTACGAATCTDGVSTGLLCSASHKCEQQVVTCLPFLCKDSTACSTSCSSDLECASGAHCEGSLCVDDLAPGQACDRPSACKSGFCVDGVCCDKACSGTCQACSADRKEDGSADGACGPAKADTDPHNDCQDEPVASCDKNGQCDGKGQCALHAAGTECQPAACAVDGEGFRVDRFVCDGSGTCQAALLTSCGLFTCQQDQCKTACAGDADCAASAYCDDGACVARKALGAVCQAALECQSGFCVDGVCCNRSCDGQCEACDVSKALGLCVPISDAPHGKRAACASDAPADPCKQRTCDGTDRTSCKGYVGSTTSCKAPSCADGVASRQEFCNGKGACVDQETVRCEPYVCNGAVCAESCKSDADCSSKFRCNLSKGECIPRTGATCEDRATLVDPDGTKISCAPYACEGSACKSECSSVLDCALPNICDEATRTCVPAVANVVDDAGCQASPGPARGGAFALALLALLGLRRRKATPLRSFAHTFAHRFRSSLALRSNHAHFPLAHRGLAALRDACSRRERARR